MYPNLKLYLKSSFFEWINIEKKLLKKAILFKPDLIAFTSDTVSYSHVKHMAKRLREVLDVPQIIGGVHASILPEHVISTGGFDFLCVGEGEAALLELVTCMEERTGFDHIDNIWAKKEGKIHKSPVRSLVDNLDSLPFPDRDIFRQYGILTTDYNIIASRGCPYHCSYCCNHIYQKLYRHKGKFTRRRSVDNVIEELKIAKKDQKIRSVYFWDDAFLIHQPWLEEFSDKYPKEIGLLFHCLSRPEDIDEKTIGLLKQAGCRYINMGLESGNGHIRKDILKRKMSNEQIIRAAHLIKNHDIRLNVFNMFGIPGETPDNMWETVRLNEQISPDGTFSFIFTPFLGTELAEKARSSGMMNDAQVENMKEGFLSGIFPGSHENNLDHPYKDLALKMRSFLPIINISPSWMRPYFYKKISENKSSNVSKIVHIISLLLADRSRIKYKVDEILKLLNYFIFKSLFYHGKK